MKIGIVGGPYAGKTILFQALAAEEGEGIKTEAVNKGFSLATVKVPDERLDYLTTFYPRSKIVRAEVCFIDIPRPGKERTGGGWETETLTHIRNMDALISVLRAFENPRVPLDTEGLNPLRDLKELEAEFQFIDLIIVEKRLERLKKENAKGSEVQSIEKALELLNQGISLRLGKWNPEEAKVLTGYAFLSMKPLLVVLNVSEDGYSEEEVAALKDWIQSQGLCYLQVCCQLERELAGLSPDEQEEFMQEWGVQELARPRLIESSYQLLDLISFLTFGDKEARAWPIPRGTTATQAAGKIHSDIERGFIRAEVIHHDQLKETGSPAEARKRGFYRLEGKDYVVQDGDVITFRFNV
ncbi:MAG: DUF933 domain-containing protein [Candidatus Binatia bacterium]|nr:DUF933 domain-containing protein [Candidatus Binatia bacterium]